MNGVLRCRLAGLALVLTALVAGCATRPSVAGPSSRASGAAGARAGQQLPPRMFVIFAERADDERLEEQRHLLGPGLGELQKRGVRVVEVVGTDPMRDGLDVPYKGFHTVVVDHDLSPMIKRDRVMPWDEIVHVLDSAAYAPATQR